MSLRTRVFALVEVLLRVPPLFIIDELLKVGIGLGDIQEYELTVLDPTETLGGGGGADPNETAPLAASTTTYDPTFYSIVAVSLLRLLLSTLGCLGALCLFVLTKKQLMVVYMYITSVVIVFISYWKNVNMARIVVAALENAGDHLAPSLMDDLLSWNFAKITEPNSYATLILHTACIQLALAFIFSNVHLGPRHPHLQKLLPFMFLAPSIAATLPLPPPLITHAPVFAALLPLALVKYVLWGSILAVVHTLYNGYLHARNYIANFGLSALIEAEWMRLSVPEVLRTFWLLRVFENAGLFFLNGLWHNIDDLDPVFRLVKNLMVTGCDTLTAVLGITSVVSYICHHIGLFVQWVMLSEDENEKSVGTVSAILFYILALQTGLTGLEPDKRFVRLCRNFCLLFTALLHFIHNMVNPLLMSLSAAHNPSLKKHLRVLLVCAFLVVFPLLLLAYVWSYHDTSTWLLAVSAFSIEVIVKVAVSLAIYTLFLLDARRQTFWESLDDYVYYIRAFGNTVEFCFGIFLFFNGAWILVFESGGAIRAVMMCIHAYFNIWCDARAGWSVFMKRRTAVHKIDSLPEAEEEQLRALDDVCAICYQEMRTAKITRCRHFFHGVCLRKWLYVQDRCPLCHEILHSVEYEDKEREEGIHAPLQALAAAPPPNDDAYFHR